MCLVVTSKMGSDAHNIAQHPIKVYKIMKKYNDCYFFPIRPGSVAIGKTVYAKTKSEPFRKHIYDPRLVKIYVEGEGVHAYVSLPAARNSWFGGNVITEWEIPKGTKYWVGDFRGEIAATQMKFIREVEPRVEPEEDIF